MITIANRFSFKIIGFTLPWLSIHEHLCRLSRVVKADLDGTIFAYDSIVGVGPKNGLQRVVSVNSLVQHVLVILNLQSQSYTLLDVEIVDHHNPQIRMNE